MVTFDHISESWQRVCCIAYMPGLRKPCWNCGQDTPYEDVDFGTRLCSLECQDVKTGSLWAARGLLDIGKS